MNVYTLIVLGLFCQLSSGRKNIAEEKTVLSHVVSLEMRYREFLTNVLQ